MMGSGGGFDWGRDARINPMTVPGPLGAVAPVKRTLPGRIGPFPNTITSMDYGLIGDDGEGGPIPGLDMSSLPVTVNSTEGVARVNADFIVHPLSQRFVPRSRDHRLGKDNLMYPGDHIFALSIPPQSGLTPRAQMEMALFSPEGPMTAAYNILNSKLYPILTVWMTAMHLQDEWTSIRECLSDPDAAVHNRKYEIPKDVTADDLRNLNAHWPTNQQMDIALSEYTGSADTTILSEVDPNSSRLLDTAWRHASPETRRAIKTAVRLHTRSPFCMGWKTPIVRRLKYIGVIVQNPPTIDGTDRSTGAPHITATMTGHTELGRNMFWGSDKYDRSDRAVMPIQSSLFFLLRRDVENPAVGYRIMGWCGGRFPYPSDQDLISYEQVPLVPGRGVTASVYTCTGHAWHVGAAMSKPSVGAVPNPVMWSDAHAMPQDFRDQVDPARAAKACSALGGIRLNINGW